MSRNKFIQNSEQNNTNTDQSKNSSNSQNQNQNNRNLQNNSNSSKQLQKNNGDSGGSSNNNNGNDSDSDQDEDKKQNSKKTIFSDKNLDEDVDDDDNEKEKKKQKIQLQQLQIEQEKQQQIEQEIKQQNLQIQTQIEQSQGNYDIVIIGGGCSALAFLLNAYRNDQLEKLIGQKGLCIIEKTDRFGGGSLEDNLIPSNTHTIGILKYIMREKEAQMLIGDFLNHIKLKENQTEENNNSCISQINIDMKKIDEAILPIFKPLLSSQIVQYIKSKGVKTSPLPAFGYFLRLAGYNLLKHLKNETNFKIDLKFNHTVSDIQQISQLDIEKSKLPFQQFQNKKQQQISPEKNNQDNKEYKVKIKKDQDQSRYLVFLQQFEQKPILGNHIIKCTGGLQKYNEMYDFIENKKKFTSDQFLKEEGFLKGIDIFNQFKQQQNLLQNSQIIVQKSISIIGGSHSSLSAAHILIYGPYYYFKDELQNPSEFKQYLNQTCKYCSKNGYNCLCYGNIQPKNIDKLKNWKIPEFYEGQIKIFHRNQFRISPRFNVNAYSGLRGPSKDLYENIIKGKEKRVKLIQFSDLKQIKTFLMQSAFVVECLGYATNYITLKQSHDQKLKYQKYMYFINQKNQIMQQNLEKEKLQINDNNNNNSEQKEKIPTNNIQSLNKILNNNSSIITSKSNGNNDNLQRNTSRLQQQQQQQSIKSQCNNKNNISQNDSNQLRNSSKFNKRQSTTSVSRSQNKYTIAKKPVLNNNSNNTNSSKQQEILDKKNINISEQKIIQKKNTENSDQKSVQQQENQFKYINDIDHFAKMDQYHQINYLENFYGTGLGFGLQTDHPSINAERFQKKKIRADSLQVYLHQLSNKIIQEILNFENRENYQQQLEDLKIKQEQEKQNQQLQIQPQQNQQKNNFSYKIQEDILKEEEEEKEEKEGKIGQKNPKELQKPQKMLISSSSINNTSNIQNLKKQSATVLKKTIQNSNKVSSVKKDVKSKESLGMSQKSTKNSNISKKSIKSTPNNTNTTKANTVTKNLQTKPKK